MIVKVFRREALAETRRAVRLLNLLGIVIGGVLILVSVLTTGPDKAGIDKAFEVVGEALVAAGLVSLVFGSLTIRETTLRMDDAVTRAVDNVLEPVREEVFRDAASSYRWDCHLVAPPADDPWPDYAYQLLNISRREPELPIEIRAICIAARDDSVLIPYAQDERYLLRWMIEDELAPANPQVFVVDYVAIDGQQLPSETPTAFKTADGHAAAEYKWQLPPELRRLQARHISFSATVRLYVGAQRRFQVRALVFKTVTDAEFRLTVDKDLRVERIDTTAAEVTPLGPHRGLTARPMYLPPHDSAGAMVQLRHPLQAGSAVSFDVRRHGPQDDRDPRPTPGVDT